MDKGIRDLLKARMEQLSIKSEARLAQMSGLPQPTVYRILNSEKANPTYDKLHKLLNVLEIPCLQAYSSDRDIQIISGLSGLKEEYKQVLLDQLISLKKLP